MDDGFGPVQWFDWEAVKEQHGKHLPHYEMTGAIYFVTFRLGDSLPAEVYERLVAAREEFLQRSPLPHSDEQDLEYKRVYMMPLLRYLDQGLGECVLRDRAVQEVLLETLLHCDGERYQIGDYVVMPNHVHLLMRVRRDLKMRAVCRQWKNLSATRINKVLGRSGRLWQPEPFDHILRGPEKLEQCRRYIAGNPRGLREGEFVLGEGVLFRGEGGEGG